MMRKCMKIMMLVIFLSIFPLFMISNVFGQITVPEGYTYQIFASGVFGASTLAADSTGNLYVGRNGGTHLWKITPDGVLMVMLT